MGPDPILHAHAVLEDLWRRRLDTLAAGIANDDPYYLQIANAAEHISAEHQGRFLIELIQNANDQAVRAGLVDSFVTAFRTEGLLAVGNSGQPFDKAKVDSITSIFKSDKTADVCIGNKGIGFKAVFQVADTAEIFSSAPGKSLAEGAALAFRMVQRPFDDPTFAQQVRSLIEGVLRKNPARADEIRIRFSNQTDAVSVILQQASRAAGFTFPLPATPALFAQRVSELDIPESVLADTQTLIVLPLSESGTAERIETALDEIQGGGEAADALPPASSLMFLPGIARIDVFDHVRGLRAELRREAAGPAQTAPGGVSFHRQRSSCVRYKLGEPAARTDQATRDWWVAERSYGGGSNNSEAELEERRALQEAIRALKLPEENWKGVDHVPVAVALPIPSKPDGQPLGPEGRFCIGLPTQVCTGLPLWVSSHFHGKIDRTAIDFSNSYNELLLDAAVGLAGKLIEHLKADSNVGVRRLVTLAMERERGELADAFYGEEGIAAGEVVLSDDGSFIKASELVIPSEPDLKLFDQVAAGIEDLESYGFRLADRLLLSNARDILEGLADEIEADRALYAQRQDGRPSLLEHAAAYNRTRGPAFWEPFLTWLLSRFTSELDSLRDQVLLPTGTMDLSRSEDSVFFPPVTRADAGGKDDEEEDRQVVDDAGEELSAIDESVALLLKFFDTSAITVRAEDGKDYTSLGQRLAPNAGGGLVKRPRQAELINDTLIPALRRLHAEHDKAIALLHQALVWLVAMRQKSRDTVKVDELLVPVRAQGETWSWVPAGEAYFSEGWLDDQNIALLTEAYGSRPNSQLIAWDRFERRLQKTRSTADKTWWAARMREIGVWDCPRVIRSESAVGVMKANSYTQLTILSDVRCPTPETPGLWSTYLRVLADGKKSSTKNGPVFYLGEVSWIDGLEDPVVRPKVMEAMLRRPDRYSAHTHTTLAKRHREDQTSVSSLWVFALRSERWAVFPTSHGLRSADDAWFLPPEFRSARGDRYEFLACVKAEFSGARELLARLGIVTLDDADVPRLVRGLHELAPQIASTKTEALRHVSALAHDLYEAIQVRLKNGTSEESLRSMADQPVPLLRDDEIRAVDLKELDALYVDDDSIRRRYIGGFASFAVLPKRSHQTYNELIDALRHVLGEDKVRRVSEQPIDVRFTGLEQGVSILDCVKTHYPARPVAVDLALLIVKGGAQSMSPQEATFRQAWARVREARLVRGTFAAADMGVTSCYDSQHSGGAALLVASSLQPWQVIGEIWQAVGQAYLDSFRAYAAVLKDGDTDQFFKERNVSLDDRTQVEAEIGLGFDKLLLRYQPVCLALWKRANPSRTVGDFHADWENCARSAQGVCDWLKWQNVEAAIASASQLEEPAASLSLLAELQMGVRAWQDARKALGLNAYHFPASEQRYLSALRAICGHARALFAYLVVPKASKESSPVTSEAAQKVDDWITEVAKLSAPADVLENVIAEQEASGRAARDVLNAARAQPDWEPPAIMTKALGALAKAPPSTCASIKLDEEPDKAATIYEMVDEPTRMLQARQAVEALLTVGRALAEKHGEKLDATILDDHLVQLFIRGAWTNRIGVLAAVRFAMEGAAPKTAKRMKEQRAFVDIEDWRTLWRKFDELGEIPKPVTPTAPEPTYTILGSGWTMTDVQAAAAEGPNGELVKRLESAVEPKLDLGTLRSGQRDQVTTASGTGKRRPGSGGGGSKKRPPDSYLTMLGAIGEHFVYEQLRAVLGDLDLTNWQSRSREVFGYGPGDDALGYDFEYHDTKGLLTGNSGVPRCFVEVKSNADEMGGTFEISTNEWETAIRCHKERDAQYVIVRVERTASIPRIVDILIDPIQLHLDGVLDYSSRDLLVAVGKKR